MNKRTALAHDVLERVGYIHRKAVALDNLDHLQTEDVARSVTRILELRAQTRNLIGIARQPACRPPVCAGSNSPLTILLRGSVRSRISSFIRTRPSWTARS